MTDSPSRRHDAPATLLDRVERLEPYVAIRLLLLQFGVAVAVGATGSRRLDPAGAGVEGVSDSGTLFALETAARFGYPIRELIWAGDFWRIPISLFLPPQWMLWAIAAIGMIPFARFLEGQIGRLRSTAVYLLGAASMVYLDLLGFAGVTSGGLGMILAAVGAVWVLLRCEGQRIRDSWDDIPAVAWMIAFSILPIAWIHSLVHLPLDPASASVSPLVPSWIALFAAAVTGMVTILPRALRFGEFREEKDLFPEPSPGVLRLARFVGVGWGVAVLLYGVITWVSNHRIDYQLWTVEPGVQRGDPAALETLASIANARPENPFPKKRLAIQLLREKQWAEGRALLEELQNSPDLKSLQETLVWLKTSGRLAGLNLRAADERLPWRYSGVSANYYIDPLRLLQDLAHAARLEGDRERLDRLREELIQSFRQRLEERVTEVVETVEGNEKLREKETTPEEKRRVDRLRAQQLNGEAYILAELDGDLQLAYEKAREAVDLLGDPQIFDTLGWIETLLGDYENGVRNLQSALFAHEGFPSGTIYYHLGAAHEGLGKLEEARGYYRTALQLDLEWWEEVDLRDRCSICFQPQPTP